MDLDDRLRRRLLAAAEAEEREAEDGLVDAARERIVARALIEAERERFRRRARVAAACTVFAAAAVALFVFRTDGPPREPTLARTAPRRCEGFPSLATAGGGVPRGGRFEVG